MDGAIEGIGGAITAGLAAREIDAAQAQAAAAHGACANSGTPLQGASCYKCGQAGHVHRSVGHVLEEIAHGVLHVDSKGWRTLPMLAFNPGRLTRDYAHGRRACYIAPLALFLFAFFLMFLVFGLAGGGGIDSAPDDRASALAAAGKAVRGIDDALAKARADPKTTGNDIVALEAARAVAVSRQKEVRAGGNADDVPLYDEIRTLSKSSDLEVDSVFPGATAKVRRALANPELTVFKIKEKAYKLSFLLIPLSLPFVWLLFAMRRRTTLYDHSVFVLYSLSFMSLLVIALMLLSRAGDAVSGLVGTIAVIVPPLHMFLQLKGAYRLGWKGAAWRTALLMFASIVVLATYLGFILVVGLID